MSIQRVPSVPFTQIANSALRDRRLSFKARGLLALVLSNVGEWNATLSWLTSQSDHDGKAAIQAALNELTDLGYRKVEKESRGPNDIRTVVTWYHQPNEPITRPTTNLTVDKLDGRETGGSLEQHSSEQHPTEEHEELTPDPFDEFWKAYPRKVGKGQARKAWTTATKKTDPHLLVKASVAFRQWCESEQTEPQFIPHPATWLNGERWLDELVPTRKPDRMQGHIALVQELWENEHVDNPHQRELEG